jgi:hypothetical protein
LQGLPRSFDLPGLTLAAKYRAVGNGVHIEVARFVARAVARPGLPDKARLCACGCARPVTGKARAAGQSCRKRLQRKRDAAVNGRARAVTGEKAQTVTRPGVTRWQTVTPPGDAPESTP